MQHGSMEVRWYQPRDVDPHVPHDRDELYVIVGGTAVFVRAEETTAFGDEPVVPCAATSGSTVQAGRRAVRAGRHRASVRGHAAPISAFG